MSILIVGGDSKLSKILYPLLKSKKKNVFKTSRKYSNYDSLFLDFKNIDNFEIPETIDTAIIVGGVTAYNECEDNYEYAYNINCLNLPSLIEKFLKKNIFVLYISTNTVFMKNYSYPSEYSEKNPGFPYAKLKSISEDKIINISKALSKEKNLSILRLTKNVSLDTSPFDEWFNKIQKNEKFNAFNNLYFAPITFEKSSEAIIKIIEKKAPGIFHLSGEKDISYSDFAFELLKYLNKDTNLCSEINSNNLGIKLRYNHYYTSLNMSHSSSILNIEYVKLNDIYKIFTKI